MAALVEVHNQPELQARPGLRPGAWWGSTTATCTPSPPAWRPACALRPLVPPGVLVVAESGIHTRAGRGPPGRGRRGRHAGGRGAGHRPGRGRGQGAGASWHEGQNLRHHQRWRTRWRPLEAGADLLGFNFYPPSPRYISARRPARAITAALRGVGRSCMVGVFVNAAAGGGARYPGRLRPGPGPALRRRAARDVLCWPLGERGLQGAAPGRSRQALEADAGALRRRERSPRPGWWMPTAPGEYGGTGQTADWSLAAGLAAARADPAGGRAAPRERGRGHPPGAARGAWTWPRGSNRRPGEKDAAKNGGLRPGRACALDPE